MIVKPASASAALWLAMSIVLTSVAQLLFRIAMRHADVATAGIHWQSAELPGACCSEAMLQLLLGVVCYGVSMLAWLVALTRFEVSVAYPMLSISHVLVYLGAVYAPWLNETPSGIKLLGIAVIGAGVLLVASSSSGDSTPRASSDTARH